MTPLEEEYFTELTRDRTENANTLDKPSMQGAKDNAVEKYSDQAHFIYELLQNADDAGATHARFILGNNRLIFSHNGTRHFSISDPSTEKADAENGCLGDVNSITSIGNSSKSVSKSKIGKFGVGFKAVFSILPHRISTMGYQLYTANASMRLWSRPFFNCIRREDRVSS